MRTNQGKYWDQKEKNKLEAIEQQKFMDMAFSTETSESVIKTQIYTGPMGPIDWSKKTTENRPKVQLLDLGTVEAIFHVRQVINDDKVKICALNFASYRNPGGKFIEGSNAQEEMLCHSSNLYNILSHHKQYYVFNNTDANRNLYTDRALYSPDVIFNNSERTNFIKADILTCAAPNWTAAQRWNVTGVENTLVLAQRIRFIKDIAELNHVDVIILGAWGCGVFGQNPRTVAQLFDHIFEYSTIKNVVYAVPKGFNQDNYVAFDQCIRQS